MAEFYPIDQMLVNYQSPQDLLPSFEIAAGKVRKAMNCGVFEVVKQTCFQDGKCCPECHGDKTKIIARKLSRLSVGAFLSSIANANEQKGFPQDCVPSD